jgi:conjugative transfer protein CagX
VRRTTALAIALAAAIASRPAIAAADARTTFVTYAPGAVTSVRVTIGATTPIAFLPGEQITLAAIEDSVRWGAQEATPEKSPDNIAVPRISVTPSEGAQTYLTVKTAASDGSERLYRIHLQAVPHAPAQVQYVYARTIIARAATPAQQPAVPAPAAPPAAGAPLPQPPASATAVQAAAVPASATPASAAVVAPATASPAIAAATAPATATTPAAGGPAFAVAGPPAPAPNPCPNAASKVSNTVRTMQYIAQGTDAVLVVKALRKQAFAHTVFGVHSLAWYLGELAAEDIIVNHVLRNACPATKNVVSAALGAAAVVNAASIPSAPK